MFDAFGSSVIGELWPCLGRVHCVHFHAACAPHAPAAFAISTHLKVSAFSTHTHLRTRLLASAPSTHPRGVCLQHAPLGVCTEHAPSRCLPSARASWRLHRARAFIWRLPFSTRSIASASRTRLAASAPSTRLPTSAPCIHRMVSVFSHAPRGVCTWQGFGPRRWCFLCWRRESPRRLGGFGVLCRRRLQLARCACSTLVLSVLAA